MDFSKLRRLDIRLPHAMIRTTLCTVLLTITALCYGQGKRGIAYGHHSKNDLAVLSPEISWWYNWSEAPEGSVATVFGDYNFEFVPMTWNGNFNETKLRNFLTNHPETKYLLAFNEPNFLHQANLTPSQVAALWPTLEAIADDFDLKIVGPAVNYCGDCVTENGTTYTSPFDYLDDFFTACSGCRVDHIAVHSYMNTVGALTWFIGEFKKYGKPIWLTEFAGWESNGTINNVNDQVNFLIGAVDFLEMDPDVFRYSWFIGRGDGIGNYPFIDLLGANGKLTVLGEAYKQMPVHDVNHVVEIPAVIQAEAYNTMSGIQLERTSDVSGFANVGWIDAGDWLEYKISVPATDTYTLKFRIAANQNATLNFRVDGAIELSQALPNTGGWQNWSTFENKIDLTAGEHAVRLQAATGGFNINWFEIGNNLITSVPDANENRRVIIYPNPASDEIFIQSYDQDFFSIKIIDVLGRTVKSASFSQETSIDVSNLEKGVYFVQVANEENTITRKIVVW